MAVYMLHFELYISIMCVYVCTYLFYFIIIYFSFILSGLIPGEWCIRLKFCKTNALDFDYWKIAGGFFWSFFKSKNKANFIWFVVDKVILLCTSRVKKKKPTGTLSRDFNSTFRNLLLPCICCFLAS